MASRWAIFVAFFEPLSHTRVTRVAFKSKNHILYNVNSKTKEI